MEHSNKWKPKRVNRLHEKLIEPIPFKEDLTYDAIAYTDNDIFLVDFIAHVILHEANGQKTAEEIAVQIANDFVEAIRRANPEEPVVKAIEKGEYTEDVEAIFFTIYKQMAMLKKKV